MDILELLTKGGYIIFNKIVAEELGKEAAIFFGELCAESVYWTVQDKMEEDYFFSTRSNLKKQAKLSRYEQEQAKQKLLTYGLIEIKREGLYNKNYYKIKVDKMAEILLKTDKVLGKKVSRSKTSQVDGQKLAR